jgi:hypothetical protein
MGRAQDESVTVFNRFLHMHEVGERMVVRQFDANNSFVRSDAIEVHASDARYARGT